MYISEYSAHSIPDIVLPQLFPSLIYHMIKPKAVLLIFVSKKIVLTGAKVGTISFFCNHNPSFETLRTYRYFFFRSERRFTRLSTRSIPCFASSASLGHLLMRRRSCLDFLHHLASGDPEISFFSTLSLLGRGSPADAHMMSLTMSRLFPPC